MDAETAGGRQGSRALLYFSIAVSAAVCGFLGWLGWIALSAM